MVADSNCSTVIKAICQYLVKQVYSCMHILIPRKNYNYGSIWPGEIVTVSCFSPTKVVIEGEKFAISKGEIFWVTYMKLILLERLIYNLTS